MATRKQSPTDRCARNPSDGGEEQLPDVIIADEVLPLVKPRVYDMVFLRYETARMFRGKAPKLILWFKIADFTSEYFEAEVPRYYNVQEIIGKPGPSGRFKAGKKGDFLREYLTLFPAEAPHNKKAEKKMQRFNRIPMSVFKGVLIECKVSTVTHARGKPIPEPLQYSKIEELRKVLR